MTPITLTIVEAADILKVHPNTVQDLISKGHLPSAKIGRAHVIMTHHVVAYIEAQVTQQTNVRMGAPTRSTKARRPGRLPAGLRTA